MGSPAAMAGATANIGAVSEYLFRGLPQSAGAALQGGADLKTTSGLYVGTWASNISFASATGTTGGAEVDVYGGFSGTAGDIGYDVGTIYYYYSEENEPAGAGPDPSNNTLEIYGKLTFGPATGGIYYSVADYFATTDDPVLYPFLDLNFALSKKLTLGLHVGQQMFDDDVTLMGTTDDAFTDYSIGVTATADSGISAGLKLVGTDADDDHAKAVLSAGYTFDL